MLVILSVLIVTVAFSRADNAATLTITQPYATTYYGDKIVFSCSEACFMPQTVTDTADGYNYTCSEFGYYRYWGLSSYFFGSVCCAVGARSYHWPGLNIEHEQCQSDVEGASLERRMINLTLELTPNMTDTDTFQDLVHYACVLHTTKESSWWGLDEEETESDPLVSIPVSELSDQLITLETVPEIVYEGQLVILRCKTTNTIAAQLLLQTGGASVQNLLKNNEDAGNYSYSETQFRATDGDNGTQFTCSDGGRPEEGRSFVRYTLVVNPIPTTSTTRTTTRATTVSTSVDTESTSTVAPLTAEVEVTYPGDEPSFVGQKYVVMCSAVFNRPPQSFKSLEIVRRLLPLRPKPEALRCPELWLPSPQYVSRQTDDIDGIANCSLIESIINSDESNKTTHYAMTVRVGRATPERQQYGCKLEFTDSDGEGDEAFSSWVDTVFYYLPAWTDQILIPPEIKQYSTPTATCMYGAGLLPNHTEHRLLLRHQTLDVVLESAVLGSNSNISISSIINSSMTGSDFIVTCEIQGPAASRAVLPQPLSAQVTVLVTTTTTTTVVPASNRKVRNSIQKTTTISAELPDLEVTVVFPEGQPVFIGSEYDVTCLAVFRKHHLSFKQLKMARRLIPNTRRLESLHCPELSYWAYWGKGEDNIGGTADCTGVDVVSEEGKSMTKYSMLVNMEEATEEGQEFGCILEYSEGEESDNVSVSDWLSPIFYHLPPWPTQTNIPTQMVLGSSPMIGCVYQSGLLPTDDNYILVIRHSTLDLDLGTVPLESRSNNSVQATLISNMTSTDFSIGCEIRGPVYPGMSLPEPLRYQIEVSEPVNVTTTAIGFSSVSSPVTTRKTVTTPSTEAVPVSNSPDVAVGDTSVVMTLEEIDDGATPNLLRYNGRAKFTCTATLATAMTDTGQLDGLTLEIKTQGGDIYEDGCVSKTVLPAGKRFFENAVKSCPVFDSSTNAYTARIDFTVSNKFLGKNEYRCVFRTQTYSYFYQYYYSSIGGRSSFKEITGIAVPVIQVSPNKIRGFENEIIEVTCTSSGGFPTGETKIRYGTGASVESSRIVEGNIESVTTEIKLKPGLINQTLVCNNSEHQTTSIESTPIVVTYIKAKGNGTVIINNVKEDITVDCSSQIETNGGPQYRWTGSIVPYSQKERSRVDLLYSISRLGGTKRINCVSGLQGDPFKRLITTRYVLNYVEARTPNDVNRSSNSAVASVIVTILLFTLAIIGYAVGRVITSRKINNRVMTRDLEKHHNKAEAMNAAKSLSINEKRKLPVTTTSAQTENMRSAVAAAQTENMRSAVAAAQTENMRSAVAAAQTENMRSAVAATATQVTKEISPDVSEISMW